MGNDVHFSISAKTARLIGRENIPTIEGALLELVKNSYDADATCSVILCDIPYPKIPPLHFDEAHLDKANSLIVDIVNRYYSYHAGEYYCISDVENDDKGQLIDYFSKINRIVVIDNGFGMSLDTINSVWMTIGTSDKEKNPKTQTKNRIKTGAKGIGRFAVDKLSNKTRMITKANGFKTVFWEIDWNQFDQSKLLSDVAANEIEIDENFEKCVFDFFGIKLNEIGKADTDWSSGTCIVLSPLREVLSEKQFERTIRSLRNINPLQSSDRFDVFIYRNGDVFLQPSDTAIEKSMYDYHVVAKYDGHRKILLSMERNEIDTEKEFVQDEVATRDTVLFSLDEFWGAEWFASEQYTRNSFAETIVNEYDVEDFFSFPTLAGTHPSAEEMASLGEVSFDFYFVKNSSPEGDITKAIQPRVRGKILNDYVGVRLFRDNIRVRPYGDQGALEDWIGLGIRHGKSPAAASHESGAWRISPNQIIGSVDIGRDRNPLLVDNANREGITPCTAFDHLIDFLQEVLCHFEYDRQYPIRNYSKWLKSKEAPYKTKANEILDRVKNRRSILDVKGSVLTDNHANQEKAYSSIDYENTIAMIIDEEDSKEYMQSVILSLCTAGMLTSTFVHEAHALANHLDVRMGNLETLLNAVIDSKSYEGDPDLDPFKYLGLIKADDGLLSSWISLILNTSEKNSPMDSHIVCEKLEVIINNWLPFLQKKKISAYSSSDDSAYPIKILDLALIINNFILNSAWFLEKQAEGEKKIEIMIAKELDNGLFIHLVNSGPPLDTQFVRQPNTIFEPGVSSKSYLDPLTGEEKKGTGFGLWFMKTVVEKYHGAITVEKRISGFGLEIHLP